MNMEQEVLNNFSSGFDFSESTADEKEGNQI